MSSGLGHIARGVETWADTTATALHDRGTDVTLFKGGGTADRPFEKVVRCAQRYAWLAETLAKWTPGWTWHIGCGSPYDVEQTTFAAGVLGTLRREHYDVVHLQDPWLAYLLEQTRALHGAKVILGNGTEEPPEFLAKFEHIQELTPYYLERHGDLGDRKWFAAPNFIDADRFRPGDPAAARRAMGLPEDAFVVLSVAALNRSRKRLDWIIREFARADMPAAVLVLAGAEEPETADLVEEGRQLLGKRLVVRTNVPFDEMPQVYHAGDVHVLGSLQEVMGISLVEAMASGLPCIGHCWPATEWVIGDGGSIVDMQQPGNLAGELQRYRDEEFRHERGQAARRRVENVFSIDAVITQYLAMYRTVCGLEPVEDQDSTKGAGREQSTERELVGSV
ncbi:D-inositol 3-phosphate glycosyltransferase [Maioricimonas rarisocia]|uniref:D-inositol 3-phosphate glycosyltransferase n=2 Tax=Maioricimonas rarisocia TaxID=2528026 RepID=A0A517Z7I1_9PLAN|nr:D-inositol 3-phosphate glycosyltransferase [Maioricimonas rarisocia]